MYFSEKMGAMVQLKSKSSGTGWKMGEGFQSHHCLRKIFVSPILLFALLKWKKGSIVQCAHTVSVCY